MKKKFFKRLIFGVLSISVILVAGKWIKASAENSVTESTREDVNMEVQEQDEVLGNLSKYDYEVHITDQEEIKEIVNNYGIDDTNGIEEIVYIPIDEDAFTVRKNKQITTFEWGANEYYIKKKGTSEAKGDLIRSSWYRYPSGSMTISEQMSIAIEFSGSTSISAGSDKLKAELTAAFGFNVTKSVAVSDTQNVTVAKGCKRNVKAYVNNKVYDYELWEDDVWEDDYIGKGKVKKPIGVIFTIGSNVEL